MHYKFAQGWWEGWQCYGVVVKPNCLLEISLLLSRWSWSCLLTTVSITLLMMLSKETGRYLVGSALESLLWTGMTKAVFHWSGKVPFEKQSWKRRHNGLASSAQHSFKTLLGTRWGPDTLSGLRRRRIFVMSLDLKTTLSSKTRGCTVASWCWRCPSSSLHFSAKIWQKMSALSFAVVYTVSECSMAGFSEWPVLPERES